MIAILGVGNVLLSDDGLGVRVVEEIKRRYRLPEGVLLIEGGTLGISLLNLLEGVEKLAIVDAIRGVLILAPFTNSMEKRSLTTLKVIDFLLMV